MLQWTSGSYDCLHPTRSMRICIHLYGFAALSLCVFIFLYLTLYTYYYYEQTEWLNGQSRATITLNMQICLCAQVTVRAQQQTAGTKSTVAVAPNTDEITESMVGTGKGELWIWMWNWNNRLNHTVSSVGRSKCFTCSVRPIKADVLIPPDSSVLLKLDCPTNLDKSHVDSGKPPHMWCNSFFIISSHIVYWWLKRGQLCSCMMQGPFVAEIKTQSCVYYYISFIPNFNLILII